MKIDIKNTNTTPISFNSTEIEAYLAALIDKYSEDTDLPIEEIESDKEKLKRLLSEKQIVEKDTTDRLFGLLAEFKELTARTFRTVPRLKRLMGKAYAEASARNCKDNAEWVRAVFEKRKPYEWLQISDKRVKELTEEPFDRGRAMSKMQRWFNTLAKEIEYVNRLPEGLWVLDQYKLIVNEDTNRGARVEAAFVAAVEGDIERVKRLVAKRYRYDLEDGRTQNKAIGRWFTQELRLTKVQQEKLEAFFEKEGIKLKSQKEGLTYKFGDDTGAVINDKEAIKRHLLQDERKE